MIPLLWLRRSISFCIYDQLVIIERREPWVRKVGEEGRKVQEDNKKTW